LSPNDVPLALLAVAIASALVGSLFAAADTALTSLSPTRLAALIEQAEGPDKAAFERIRSADAKLRSRYLLGRILSATITSVLTLLFFLPLFPRAAAWVAFGATVGVTATLYEVSTTLARKHADRAAPLAARYLRPLEIAMLPLAIPLSWLGAVLSREEPNTPPDPEAAEAKVEMLEAEVEMLVEEGARSGLFGREPAEMIRNVLEFQDRTAKDAMIPRSRVEAIEISMPLEKVLQLVSESGHSRYPVYREQLDNVVGLLYAKDLFKVLEEHRLKKTSLREIVRSPANFVAESQPLSSLLKEMRGRRQHLAIVVDEFGGVSGIVTMEDVLEEIVGEIEDEFDVTEEQIEQIDDDTYRIDGMFPIEEFNARFGTDLPDEDYHTVGGFVFGQLGRLPKRGDTIQHNGYSIRVESVRENRIEAVRIRQRGEASTAP